MVRFFRCEHCGKIVYLKDKADIPTICCGEAMKELKANTTDAAMEKHIPVVTKSNLIVDVKVGSTKHPMTEDHYIEWIYLETEKGSQIKYLSPSDEPEALFALNKDTADSVYAYCNLHGLWVGK